MNGDVMQGLAEKIHLRDAAIDALIEALEPFAALLDAEGVSRIGGATYMRPQITVHMVTEAKRAIELARRVK